MNATRGTILFLFIMSLAFFSSASVGQDLEWATTYRIEVRVDGSARWVLERRAFLETAYDEATFNYYASLEFHDALSKNVSAWVKDASLRTGRWNMTVGPLTTTTNIFRTATGSYGVVKYQYDWIGFAESNGTRIQVVDVFADHLFPFGDGPLLLEYPSGYGVADVFPLPDDRSLADRTLMWNGTGGFGDGEPSLVLEQRSWSVIDLLRENLPFISLFALVGAGSAGLWLLRFRRRRNAAVTRPGPPAIESEEAKVERLLEAAGGYLPQSTIARQCGFSKTKTSLLLTRMEAQGIIRRQKTGREKLVMLTQPKDLKKHRNSS